jgi:hypothetical protein
MAFQVTRRLVRLSGTASAIATTGVVVLSVDSGGSVQIPGEIHRVKIKRTSGSAAATFVPRIHSESNVVAASVTQEYLGTSTATTALFDAVDIQASFLTDTAGKLYLVIAPDVNGDTFAYQVDLYIYR